MQAGSTTVAADKISGSPMSFALRFSVHESSTWIFELWPLLRELSISLSGNFLRASSRRRDCGPVYIASVHIEIRCYRSGKKTD